MKERQQPKSKQLTLKRADDPWTFARKLHRVFWDAYADQAFKSAAPDLYWLYQKGYLKPPEKKKEKK